MRLGVTGHRTLADPDAVAAAVDAVLDRLTGGGAVPVELHTSLAEGADRLVAERALARPGSRIVAVLPLGGADYERDFADADSVAAFRHLLAAASEVVVTEPAPTREEAYERAGRAVVVAVDVLVAIWDGRPARGRGGTAEIVAFARERGIPVEVVSVP